MDKGIRPHVNAKFVELNNQRNRGELTNTQFRKNVMFDAMEQFGCTLASAATHYNHAFKLVKGLNAELVSGLGRADDKKGGRKRKATLVAEAVTLLLGYTATPAVEGVLISEGIKDHVTTHTVTVNPELPVAAPTELVSKVEDVPAVQTYTVTRAKDGVVVATGLVLHDAETLVAKAVAAKKAKLVFA